MIPAALLIISAPTAATALLLWLESRTRYQAPPAIWERNRK